MSRRTTPMPRELRALLNASGVAWDVEQGRRHYLLRVNGVVVQILPHSRGWDRGGRHGANAMAAVRRHLREIGRLP